ncbi:hypothetical protein KQI84_00740 [bacterium]|nr:hypothetical protein [bacterium]
MRRWFPIVLLVGALLAVSSDSQGGQISVTWIADNGWGAPSSWSPAVIPDNNPSTTCLAIIDANPGTNALAVLSGSYTIDGLDVGAGDSLQIGAGSVLSIVSDSFTNDGSVDLPGGASPAILEVSSGSTIHGTGQISLSQSSVLAATGGTSWTIGASQTIRGSDSAEVRKPTNLGEIVGESPGALRVNGGANQGLIQASSGGQISLEGTIDNTGGVIDGNAVSTADITGGDISNGARFQDSTIRGVSLEVYNQLNPGDTLHLDGDITNNGTLQVFQGFIDAASSSIVSGSGEFYLDSAVLDGTSAPFVNGPSHTMRGGLGTELRNLHNLGQVAGENPGDPLRFIGGVNQGTILSNSINAVSLEGTIDNTGGVIEGTVVSLADITGGTLANGVRFQNSVIRDVTLEVFTEGQPGDQLTLDGQVTNNGTLQAFGMTIATSGTALLSGPGEFILDGATLDGTSAPLTNGPTHTIRGGNLAEAHNVYNQGTIAGEWPGSPLRVIGGSNVGVFQSSGSNSLTLEGSITNTGGAIDGPAVALGSITGGTLSNGVRFQDAVIRDVTLEVFTEMQPGDHLTLDGEVTNNGTLQAFNATIASSTTSQLLGIGELITDGTIIDGTAAPLFNGPGHTIRGGNLAELRDLRNLGTISGEWPGSPLRMIGGTNEGVIQCMASNALTLEGVIDNTGGVVDGSAVALGDLTGGTLSNGVRFQNAVVRDVTLEVFTEAQPGDSLILDGDLVNNGTLQAFGATIATSSSTVLSGPGELILDGAILDANTAPLFNTASHTIRGGNYSEIRGIRNFGLIQGDWPGAPLRVLGGINRGLITASGSDALSVEGTIDNNSGTIDGPANIYAIVAGGVIANGGRFTSATLNSVALEITNEVPDGGTLVLDGGVTNNGTLMMSGLTGLTLANATQTLDGLGEILMDGGMSIDAAPGAILTQSSSHRIQGNGAILHGAGGFRNEGQIVVDWGTMTVQPGAEGFVNAGVLQVSSAGVLEFVGAGATQESGSMLVEGAVVAPAGSLLIQGGTIGGNGNVQGTLELAGGTAAPGLSAGTLTVDGDYSETAASALEIEIGGYVPGLEHDLMAITGNAGFAGNLHVQVIDGFVPASGDEFTVATYSSHSGSHSSILGSNLGGNLYLIPSYGATRLTLIAALAGDQNGDGEVVLSEFNQTVLAFRGLRSAPLSSDLDGNGIITIDELNAALQSYRASLH